MSYSLNSLKGCSIGDYIGDHYSTIGAIKGDTRSLDYSSSVHQQSARLGRHRHKCLLISPLLEDISVIVIRDV